MNNSISSKPASNEIHSLDLFQSSKKPTKEKRQEQLKIDLEGPSQTYFFGNSCAVKMGETHSLVQGLSKPPKQHIPNEITAYLKGRKFDRMCVANIQSILKRIQRLSAVDQVEPMKVMIEKCVRAIQKSKPDGVERQALIEALTDGRKEPWISIFNQYSHYQAQWDQYWEKELMQNKDDVMKEIEMDLQLIHIESSSSSQSRQTTSDDSYEVPQWLIQDLGVDLGFEKR